MSRRPPPDRPDEATDGFALLIVLWAVGLLALAGTAMTMTGRIEVQRARNLGDSAVTEAAADGVVFETVLRVASGAWRPADSAVHAVHVGAVRAEVRLEDETRKINPNFASRPVLQALLSTLGVEAARARPLAAAMVDWRTRSPSPQPDGAKAPQYRAAGLAYGPPGRPYASLDELGLVLGVTPDVLALLRPHLSIYTGRADAGASIDPTATEIGQTPGIDESSSGRSHTVAVLVRAVGPGDSLFTRRAVVRVNAHPDPGEAAYGILTWERPAP